MDKMTLHDYLEICSEHGRTDGKRNLYPKQERTLLAEGFSVQRLSSVNGYPNQNCCRISWKHAIPGTVAYELLRKAAEVHPELLKKPEESNEEDDDFVPPPYSHGGGWEQP